MAGEIVALGEDVNPNLWKVGDRVSANFTQDHIDGDLTPEIQLTALGGQIDGCLTEYRTFPAYVSLHTPCDCLVADVVLVVIGEASGAPVL